MRTQVKDSQLHLAIANMAQFLESFASKEEYGFLDGGETLEISTALLNQCRESDQWQALEQAYQLVFGNIYCPDREVYLDVC